jgi:purine-cytosine permease-like protein
VVPSLLMWFSTIASSVVSRAACASEYSRYMKPGTSRKAIFPLTLAGALRDPAPGRAAARQGA